MNILGSVESETYQRLVTTLRQLKNKNSSLESECDLLKKEIASACKKKSVLQNKLQSLKSSTICDKSKETENTLLLLKIKEMKAEHEENTAKLVELNRILEVTVNKLCEERKKRRNVEAKTSKIIENIKNLSIVAQKLQANPEQEKKNEQLSQKLEDKKSKWKVTKQELLSQIKMLQDKRDQSLESVHNTQIQIDMRIGLIDELNEKVEKRNQTISKLKNEIQVAKEDLEKVQNSLLEKRNEIEQLNNKEETLRNEIVKAKNSLSALKTKYEKEREKFRTVKAGFEQLREGVENKIAMMRADSEKGTLEKIVPLEEELNNKDIQIKELREKLDNAQKNKENALSKLKSIEIEREKERKIFQQTKAQYEAKCQAMQKAIGTITSTTTQAPNSDI